MTRESRGWVLATAMLPIITVNLLQVARQRAALASMWPTWRPVILDLTLVIAGAALVAAVVAGVHAWRAAERGGHA